MKEENQNPDPKGVPRRGFLKSLLLGGVAAGCTPKDPFTALAEEENVLASGEKVQLLSTTGEIIEVDRAFLKPVPEDFVPTSQQAREGIDGKSFVRVIDLGRCRNLKKCQEACDAAHGLDEAQDWLKIYPLQDAEKTAPYWAPSSCMHCEEPPCVKVCPVDATFQRKDGIVGIDADRCIGCRFCMAACPYSARVFNWEKPLLSLEELQKEYSSEKGTPPSIGTVSKCNFCSDKVRDGELPRCVSACPNGVFYFGDINEDVVTNGSETVRFSELIRDRAGYRMLEDLGTKPRVYYLPPVDRLFPFENETVETEEGEPS